MFDGNSFLESLDIQIGVEATNEFNIQRIAQMTQKTNQFNLTTHRYTDADVRGFVEAGWKIWCISVAESEDGTKDYELKLADADLEIEKYYYNSSGF